MQRLKAELLILCRQHGDAGTSEEHQRMIDTFLDALQTYVTEDLLVTMQPGAVRVLYAHWVRTLISAGDAILAKQALAPRIWTSTADRAMVESQPSNNVVSIFNSLTRH